LSFRRDYTISVVTSFKATSSPFSTYAANVTEPTAPTAVDDYVSTNETIAVMVAVLFNDVTGTNPILPSTLSVTTASSHGVATVIGDEIRYTPTGLYYGSDSFEYQICDNTTVLCSRATVFVTVLQVGPIAVADAARVANAGSVNVDLLSNDIAGVGGLVTLSISSGPSNCTAVVTAQKTIFYTAVPGFVDIVTISYQICDASIPTPLCSSADFAD
jgi:hypothetical protein